MEKGLISIDRWSEESRAYFLTHLHADHTRGLLYCSAVTARLLPSRFPGFELSLLRVLEVGSTRSVDLVSPATGSRTQCQGLDGVGVNSWMVLVSRTPIDADHCSGAVMYLFHGAFGWVLYTGDFRWEISSERAQRAKKMLFDVMQGDDIDVLYVDNTYCHPSFSFPPREVAAQQVVDIIGEHPNHEIIIGIDNLGKEDLLVHISKVLSTKIWVWPERLLTMHLLGYDNIFTTNTSLARIRAVPWYSLTFKTLEGLNTMHPTVGIMPSGLPWMLDSSGKHGSLCASPPKNHETEMHLARKLKQDAYWVPYSEHSCFSELEEFIKVVRPSNISGIVTSSFCYISPRYYFKLVSVDRHIWDRSRESIDGEKSDNAEAKNKSLDRCKSSIKVKVRKVGKKFSARSSLLRSRVATLCSAKRGVKISGVD